MTCGRDPGMTGGPGHVEAFVLRSERRRTQLVGCELVFVVDGATADQDEGENTDADVDADA